MNLDALFEDLANQFETMQAATHQSLRNFGSAKVTTAHQTFSLEKLIFAKDHICGTDMGKASLVFVPHRAIQAIELQPGEGKIGSGTLRHWLGKAPALLWLQIHHSEQNSAGALQFFEQGLVILSTKAIALETVCAIAVPIVENQNLIEKLLPR